MTQHEQTAPVGAPVPVVHAVPVTLPLIGTITALPERTSAIATRVLKISQLLVLLEIVTAIVSIVHHGAARERFGWTSTVTDNMSDMKG